jgi:acetyl-CoA synthetase
MAEKKQGGHVFPQARMVVNCQVVFEAAEAEKYQHPELLQHHPTPHVHGLEDYQKLYKHSIQNPNEFWGDLARDLITWHKDFSTVRSGSFTHGDMAWFPDGELSPCYNLVDRHAIKNPDSVRSNSPVPRG